MLFKRSFALVTLISFSDTTKYCKHLSNNQLTKILIKTTKNIKSLWKFIIPSIVGVAGSWNDNCQGSAASAKHKLLSLKIKTLNKNKVKKEDRNLNKFKFIIKK